MRAVEGYVIPEKYKVLEKLKVTVPEAYFYWAMAVGR